jgi:uncharacterized membrane-anchored protein YitT (DUF2179 family)
LRHMTPYLVIMIGSGLVAVGFNLFLIPHQLLSGGASGVAMLIGYYTGWNIGILYFLINFPILIWGWFAIGRRYIILSLFSVFVTTWLMQIIPVQNITIDPILGSVFGGVIIGIGTGYSLKSGGSTGGFDIIGSIVTKSRDFPLGTVIFILNASVVFALGMLNNWNLALYSMLAIYVTGKIVDTIHIRHIKITAFIVTNETKALLERLLTRPRGVTLIKTQGAFSHVEKDMLMTVTTRYELAELRKTIKEVDPKAFVNIVETVEVLGEFRRNT